MQKNTKTMDTHHTLEDKLRSYRTWFDGNALSGHVDFFADPEAFCFKVGIDAFHGLIISFGVRATYPRAFAAAFLPIIPHIYQSP